MRHASIDHCSNSRSGTYILSICSVLLAALCALNFAAEPTAVRAASASGKEHGATLFQEKGCAYCHGARGIGGGKGPDLRDIGKRRKKAQITRQIAEGGGAMPAFGDSLEAEDISDLVSYLRSKRK